MAKSLGPPNTALDTMDRHPEKLGLGRKKNNTQSLHAEAHSTSPHTRMHGQTKTHMDTFMGINTHPQLLKGTKLA